MTTISLYCRRAVLAAGFRALVGEMEECQFLGTSTCLDELKNQLRVSFPDVLVLELNGEITLTSLTELAMLAPQTRILLWLDDSSPEFLSQTLGLGVRGFLRKDQSESVHANCLRQVAAGEVWIDRELASRLFSSRRVHLSKRERELIGLLAQGLRNKEIATVLGISEGTVKVYLSRLFPKVGASDRFELALIGLKNIEFDSGNALDRVSEHFHNPDGRTVPLTVPSFLHIERMPARVI